MSRDILKLMTDDDILEGMKIRLTSDGFREKTVEELLGGAKKLMDACTRGELLEAVFAAEPEKEIRPFIDRTFPYMSFNKIGWYGVAMRILGSCIREIASHELNEDDMKKLAELNAEEKNEAAPEEDAPETAEDEAAPETTVTAFSETTENGRKTLSIAAKKAARKLSLPFPSDRDALNVFEKMAADKELTEKRNFLADTVKEVGKANTEYPAVLRKVDALVSVFGPAGIDKEAIAKQIVACDIDGYLAAGDETAVKILTDSLHDKKQTNFYIFAVRYCVMHEPEHFPFYNAATVRSLKYCRDNHGFYNFSNDELNDYGKYKKILSMFRKKYSLTGLSVSELSWVLTDAGKLLAGK